MLNVNKCVLPSVGECLIAELGSQVIVYSGALGGRKKVKLHIFVRPLTAMYNEVLVTSEGMLEEVLGPDWREEEGLVELVCSYEPCVMTLDCEAHPLMWHEVKVLSEKLKAEIHLEEGCLDRCYRESAVRQI